MGGFISAPTNLASPSAIGSTTPNTGAFTTLSATPPANTTALASSGYSVTGSGSTNLVNITGTWNTTGTPRAINVDITNTASNFDARLIDLRVGGASRFYVQVGGPARFSSGILECPSGVVNDAGSFNVVGFVNGFVSCTNTTGIRWASGTNWQASHDLFLVRDGAAGTLAQRNSTNAQTFRIYNTYTDASNYERGFMRWATNVLEIGAEAAGTGTQRTLSFLGGSNNSAISFTANSLCAVFGNNANIFYKIIQLEAGLRYSGSDAGLFRNAAGVLEVNNGTAGTFRDLIVRNFRMSAPTLVPASASATGSEGQISWDASYIYVCTATNTWKRVAIATW